eukprot:CAMPEP_0168778438 /NCGR_PEP_ID=MMETSP0725-20121227/7084_1 /TAXON_ID=265536 /ORGANISM="Amphiprora sp., Strain CCMP467" /LENGTH=358 /DNA_ID=CAMNT_0008828211 /DNA_START=23 /DNA_END=1099 /DNA_ORIENTATION=+
MAEKKDNEDDSLPWYDFQAGVPVPEHVTHLRIGVQQAQAAAASAANGPDILELPVDFCINHQTLQQLQIHVLSIQLVPSGSFARCPTLEQVEFVANAGQSSAAATAAAATSGPSQLTSIGHFAFYRCPNLRSVIGLEHLSDCLEIINSRAFLNCKMLTTLDFSCLRRLKHLGADGFLACKSLEVVDLSNAVLLEDLGPSSFFECRALKILHLPPRLKRIHTKSFCNCKALVSIIIPASVEYMDMQAFSTCSGLTRVTFQSTRYLRWLMDYDEQFRFCDSLHTLELQGPAITRKLWPRLLEQFLQEDNGILAQAGIDRGRQRVTIAWNFMRSNIANFYIDEKKPSYCRKRTIISSGDNG